MKMAQKYLIAVDMDGTLLNSQGKITEKSVAILQRLLDAGHYVVPASGRSLTLLPKEINALRGLKYGVLENGAVVWDYGKKASVYKRLLPEGAAEQILAEVKKWYNGIENGIFRLSWLCRAGFNRRNLGVKSLHSSLR